MKKTLHLLLALAAMVLAPAFAQKVLSPPPPLPPPVFTPGRILPDEKPVVIETQAEVTASNGFFQRVETTLTFTNPNGRQHGVASPVTSLIGAHPRGNESP